MHVGTLLDVVDVNLMNAACWTCECCMLLLLLLLLHALSSCFAEQRMPQQCC